VRTIQSRSSSKCYLRIQSVPQREHHTSPLQNQLVNEIITVYSENNKEHVSKLCGQPTELLKVKADGTYSYHSALRVS
jgi:hypothetical protein